MTDFYNEQSNKVAYAYYVLETVISKLNPEKTSITRKMISDYLNKNYHKEDRLYSDKRTAELIKEYGNPTLFSFSTVEEDSLMGLAKMFEVQNSSIFKFVQEARKGKHASYYEKAETYLNKKILFNSLERVKAFYGTWKGTSFEDEGSYELTLTIKKGKSPFMIFGEVEIVYDYVPGPYFKTEKVKITGSIIEKFDMLIYEFRNADNSKLQFGTTYLILSGDATTLTGSFIARGLTNNRICTGTNELKKA
jgi:hypothetical protein